MPPDGTYRASLLVLVGYRSAVALGRRQIRPPPRPFAGSFLRLSKFPAQWDVGSPLTPSVLRSRYASLDAELVAPNNLLPHVARTSGGRDKPIEFLGEIKIRGWQQPDVLGKISLRGLGINGLGDGGEEGEGEVREGSMEDYSHMTEMDLAGNLLCEWDTCLNLLRQFPNLANLSLS